MTATEFLEVRKFYTDKICQGVTCPQNINYIFLLCFPNEAEVLSTYTYRFKQRKIATYVQNKQKEVLDSFEELLSDIPLYEEESVVNIPISFDVTDTTETNMPDVSPSLSVTTPEITKLKRKRNGKGNQK